MVPCSPFGLEEAFKEGNFWFELKEVFKEGRVIQGGKRHLRREKAFKEGRGTLGGIFG